MGIIVTGMGPRSGTSAMMRFLIAKGFSPRGEKFPSYVVPELNPEGYWDLSPEELASEEPIRLEPRQCIKLFYPQWQKVDWTTVDCLIVMHRLDFDAQNVSCKKLAEAEGYIYPEGFLGAYQTEVRKRLDELALVVPIAWVDMHMFKLLDRLVLH